MISAYRTSECDCRTRSVERSHVHLQAEHENTWRALRTLDSAQQEAASATTELLSVSAALHASDQALRVARAERDEYCRCAS